MFAVLSALIPVLCLAGCAAGRHVAGPQDAIVDSGGESERSAVDASDGTFSNYDGGDPTSHDLGLELDAAVEYRLTLDRDLVLQLGTQGGVFFPGNAFADADGRRLDRQWFGIGRLGLGY